MSNPLKMYDFHLRHKVDGTNVTFSNLAVSKPELANHIPDLDTDSENIEREVIFNSFLRKLSDDLNVEVLKNKKRDKLIKKNRYFDAEKKEMIASEIETDYSNKVIYGVLHGGKVADNSTLERLTEAADNQGTEYEYDHLNGDRIYDNFFFMLHLSFRCNVARLFVLSPKNSTKTDSIFKEYLANNLFKEGINFQKTKASDYIPHEFRDEVLRRVHVSNILISKTDTIISESDNQEYKVEVKLTPKSPDLFTNVKEKIDYFRKTKVHIEEHSAGDEDGSIRFSIFDPETNQTNLISISSADNFIPRILYDDDEIMDENRNLDLVKIKAICLEFLKYNEDDQLI